MNSVTPEAISKSASKTLVFSIWLKAQVVLAAMVEAPTPALAGMNAKKRSVESMTHGANFEIPLQLIQHLRQLPRFQMATTGTGSCATAEPGEAR